MTLKNIVRVLLLLSVLYGMYISYEPLNAPVTEQITMHGWVCLFIIPGIIGWVVVMIASALSAIGLIMTFFSWVCSPNIKNEKV